jgi:hypothetical protein
VVGGEEAATMWKGGDKSAGRLISCVLSVPYVSAFVLVSRGKPSPWTSGH